MSLIFDIPRSNPAVTICQLIDIVLNLVLVRISMNISMKIIISGSEIHKSRRSVNDSTALNCVVDTAKNRAFKFALSEKLGRIMLLEPALPLGRPAGTSFVVLATTQVSLMRCHY